MHARFHDGEFQLGLERLLEATRHGAADVEEVWATCTRIDDGDADSWLAAWTAAAGAAWAAAAAGRGDRAQTLERYQRAATYYAAALRSIAYSSEPERELDLWRRQRECWDRVIELLPAPGERIAIPYENSSLPGYFFRAPDAQPGERRALLVMNNGSDRATSQMWCYAGAGASQRGYHWMTFDGPGQQAMLFERGIPFRPDWEAVLKPVADAMAGRPDVDANHMAVIGVGQGGYLVPRALAFEHRFAAAVADPGVLDVSRCWRKDLPKALREPLQRRTRVAFDREMHLAELLSPALCAHVESRGWSYGGGSRYHLYRAVESHALGEELEQITTPLLITDPGTDPFWRGQSRELHERLGTRSELLAADGSREERIFEWLERYLSCGREPAHSSRRSPTPSLPIAR
jgi:Prolyl oligopeptidase family